MRTINDQGFLTIREPRQGKRAAILVAGDCCPRAGGEALILDGKSMEILADLEGIFSSADLSLIQLETPLTTADTPIVKSGPNLKCHPGVIDFLHAWGGDITLLANNHLHATRGGRAPGIGANMRPRAGEAFEGILHDITMRVTYRRRKR
jgi:hypothetical protein